MSEEIPGKVLGRIGREIVDAVNAPVQTLDDAVLTKEQFEHLRGLISDTTPASFLKYFLTTYYGYTRSTDFASLTSSNLSLGILEESNGWMHGYGDFQAMGLRRGILKKNFTKMLMTVQEP